MDPIAVLKLVWRHRYALLPVIVVTLVAAVYVINFGPRTYQSSMSAAIVNPDSPTEIDKEFDPRLASLNSNNPYLRSSDSSLIAQVVIARLNAATTTRDLEAAGLSSDYMVAPGSSGAGFLVNITGLGPTTDSSLATTRALGARLDEELRQVQKVYGADDRYLFTSIVVAEPFEATEQFSSRLRSLIVVFLAGGVLAFAAISLARGIQSSRIRRESSSSGMADADDVNLSSADQVPAVGEEAVPKGESRDRRHATQKSVALVPSGQVRSHSTRPASAHEEDSDQ